MLSSFFYQGVVEVSEAACKALKENRNLREIEYSGLAVPASMVDQLFHSIPPQLKRIATLVSFPVKHHYLPPLTLLFNQSFEPDRSVIEKVQQFLSNCNLSFLAIQVNFFFVFEELCPS